MRRRDDGLEDLTLPPDADTCTPCSYLYIIDYLSICTGITLSQHAPTFARDSTFSRLFVSRLMNSKFDS